MKYSGNPYNDFLSGKGKKVKINLNDIDSINKSIAILGGTAEDINKAIYEEIDRVCQIGEDVAKEKVHVDSGELQTSITHKVKQTKRKIKGTVSAGTDHAMFHEFGTGLQGNGTYPGDTSGWVYDYANQGWVGHKANPYMYEAAQAMERELKK